MSIRLMLATEDPWERVIEPWLSGRAAWEDPRPSVVLTPDRARGFYLRGRLIQQDHPLLGVRFWIPSDARKFLLPLIGSGIRPLTQSELRMATRLVAEKLLRDEKANGSSFKSVVQEPAAFLRAYDLLLGAGWDPAREGTDYGQRLAMEMSRRLGDLHGATQAGIHRLLREAKPSKPFPIARVLLVGFNALHWPLWDLLQAVCSFTEDSVVILDPPAPAFGAALDQLWIGSWENLTRSNYEVVEAREEPPKPFQPLAISYEDGSRLRASESNMHFLASGDLTQQVRAVTLQVLDYLRHPECSRLGIIFPEANALALAVAQELNAEGLLYNDGPGTIQPGAFESRPWRSWLELQEEPSTGRLIEWLRACEAAKVESGLSSLSAERAADLLDRALGQSLLDDLGYLAQQMATEKGENKIVADFLGSRIGLAPEAPFAAYLISTREALRRLNWTDLLERLPETPPVGFEKESISRSCYLEWLRDVADSSERMRQPGHHFYAKIHLLLYGQMAGQSWSHLILTGLNEGVWPRLFEPGAFVARQEVTELNRRVGILNRKGTIQGIHGEGDNAVAAGHAHALLPHERYDLSLRDLCSSLGATTHAICLVAATAGGGRNLLPSDFFCHAWQAKTGRVLDDMAFRHLAKTTADRCRRNAGLFARPATESHDISAPAKAYKARRDESRPFGPYEFSYAAPPAQPLQLACKRWEDAFAHPSAVWLADVVGVEPWPEGNLNWRQAMGTWTHRWLAEGLASPGAIEDLPQRIRAASERDHATVMKRVKDSAVVLYPWWRHVWDQAREMALVLGSALLPDLPGKRIVSEFSLPSGLTVKLPGGARDDFLLRGKLDLVLVGLDGPLDFIEQNEFTLRSCWVIDFKTGSAGPIKVKDLEKGKGIQIALYGLALRALGSGTTHLSLHTCGRPLVEQLRVEELHELAETFRALDRIHRTGVLGQAPAASDEYTFAPVNPMTTRPVRKEILQAKWRLTHGVEAST